MLDVGAAQGFLGQLLHDSGRIIDAVEPDADCCRIARPFYRHVHHATIEDAPLAGPYRTIVCADVLEHTPDPSGILRRLKAVAAPDALFIISLPNVAHIAVRLMLLCGRFPRMDRGPLDRTHLQFYTRDTAADLLESAGLSVRSVLAAGVPPDEVFRGRAESSFVRVLASAQAALVRLMPRAFAMQFIFVASPRS